jgi:ketosteroid isomerase-like protein
MQPRELVEVWVEAFNRGAAEALAALYAEDAVNHQVPERPVTGRAAIRAMFEAELARAAMVCIVEHLFADGGGRSSSGATRSACAAAASSRCGTGSSFASAARGSPAV